MNWIDIAWRVVVAVIIVLGIDYFFFREENKLSGRKHKFIEVDPDDNFVDADEYTAPEVKNRL
ncbi:MAG: hypothetical protein K2H61_08245 [Muribaculaceae bacterium]|nr:hypothetical protein [Muribaculaceae bacterium]MDE7394263.1 hypothetical protein [Muribaculaceae bacterium]